MKQGFLAVKRAAVFIGLSVAVLAFYSCSGSVEGNNNPKPDEITDVKILRIDPASVSNRYVDSGILMGSREATITSAVPGTLVRFYAREGDVVKKGDVMALLDPADYKLELRYARAFENGKRKDFERVKNLYAKKAVSKAEYDSADTAYELAKVSLAQAELNLARTKISSKIKGQVVSKERVIGDRVSPGMPLFKVINRELLKLVVYLSEMEVVNLDQEDSVELEVDAYPGRIFKGHIRSVRISAMPASASFPVEIEIKSDGTLKPGMVARVSLRGATFSNLLLAPAEAIVEKMGFSYLFVYENNSVVLRKIEVGRRFGDMLEITGGLNAGDYIVPVHTPALTDGAVVNVINNE